MSRSEVLLVDTYQSLLREVRSASREGELCLAMVGWLLPDFLTGEELQTIANRAANQLGVQRNYRDVAILGYALNVAPLQDSFKEAATQGISWLIGRPPQFDGQFADFCTDGVALLGIALGVKALGNPGLFTAVWTWFEGWFKTALAAPKLDHTQRGLMIAAKVLLKSASNADNSATLPAEVYVALYSKGEISTQPTGGQELSVLDAIRSQTPSPGAARAAILVVAYKFLQRSAPLILPGRAFVADVAELLRKIPAGLRRWTWEENPKTKDGTPRKWHIDHEYHVQNLLWFLLSPIFPDARDEEYAPSVGSVHPRLDIAIPSLKLIIEAKYMRRKDTPEAIIRQIAEDSGLYLSKNSDYQAIIAFVWDASRRSEEHPLMIEGMKQIDGVVDAVLVSSPSFIE